MFSHYSVFSQFKQDLNNNALFSWISIFLSRLSQVLNTLIFITGEDASSSYQIILLIVTYKGAKEITI